MRKDNTAATPTAASAARFLDKITRDMPFPVTAIQVDGGPEFMTEFMAEF